MASPIKFGFFFIMVLVLVNCKQKLLEPPTNKKITNTTTTTSTSTSTTTTITTTKTIPPEKPEKPTCGWKPDDLKHKIVGGGEVTAYSLPWQVALVSRGSRFPFCGGTLISNQHVLTAAHCTGVLDMDIIVGEHSTVSDLDGTRHSVCRHVDHKSYNANNMDHDFSILHLDKPVELGPRAVPACLPKPDFGGNFFTGKTLTVSGWGTLSSGGGVPSVLHSVDVPGMTSELCNTLYSVYGYNITNSMLCAGKVSGGIDSCQGDSGGPLTYTTDTKPKITYLAGVVSWGIGCAGKDRPGVYARVTEVLDWINGELGAKC